MTKLEMTGDVVLSDDNCIMVDIVMHMLKLGEVRVRSAWLWDHLLSTAGGVIFLYRPSITNLAIE